ncbi:MAG: hypothetical protein K2X82_20325 [Gemmataceae bacterium]|nr:hypothetical protein [Gemmataceae bacterium]
MFPVLFAAVAAATAFPAPPSPGEVSLTVTGETVRPAGWPVLVEVTVKNVGKTPVWWWCGGPDRYPGAEHFAVRVRTNGGPEWQDGTATNGQYTAGSGAMLSLKPGESVVVPLAVPVKEGGGRVEVRIAPARWRAEPAEWEVGLDRKGLITDRLRHKVITAVMTGPSPFLRHVAEKYGDPVVLDALVKLVTVDNLPIVRGAAAILARRPPTGPGAGEALAEAVRRWLPRDLRLEEAVFHHHVVWAALSTRTEPARVAVLDMLKVGGPGREVVLYALRESPGDVAWLRRARDAAAAAAEASPDDAELRGQVRSTTDRLDIRIKNGDR